MEADNDDYQGLEEPMQYRIPDDNDLYIQLVDDMLPHGKSPLPQTCRITYMTIIQAA